MKHTFEDRIRDIIDRVLGTRRGLEVMSDVMSQKGFSVLRQARLDMFPSVDDPDRIAAARTGVILDTETTGLDPASDRITELAMLRFKYEDDGTILCLDGLFHEFNDPQMPIPADVTALTGITDAMVSGACITQADIDAFVADVGLVIAHNAAFDRQMIEGNFPACRLGSLNWACSHNEIDWKARGKKGGSLEVLAIAEGITFGSHRADADVIATAFVLNGTSDGHGAPFAEMLENARKATLHIVAANSPFDSKDELKARGYKWCPAEDTVCGHSKVWHREIIADAATVADEKAFLRDKVFMRDVTIPAFRKTAATRYSARSGVEMEFSTRQEIDAVGEPA